MNNSTKRGKRLPHGFCSDIAEIVRTDRFYVSKILRDPENFNGQLAELVKQTAEKLNNQKAEMKSAIALQSQN